MRAQFSLYVVIGSLVVVAACSAGQEPAAEMNTAAETASIRATMAKYVSGYETKDVENFVNVFTEDAVRMPPNGPVIIGSAGIRDYYQDWFEKESLDVTVSPTEIEVVGDWAVAWGTYKATVTSTEGENPRQDEGKWINVFKKGADGTWRFHRNIWNSDKPLPSTPAE